MPTASQVQIDLSEREIEYLKTIHIAQAIKETTLTPGWEHITLVIADMIARLEDQHLNFAPQASRDAYWASGLRLTGARQFAKVLQERIAKDIDILNQPLVPPSPPSLEDFDGDEHGNRN